MKQIEFIYGRFEYDNFLKEPVYTGKYEVNDFLADPGIKACDIRFMPFSFALENEPDRMAVAIIYEVENVEDDG